MTKIIENDFADYQYLIAELSGELYDKNHPLKVCKLFWRYSNNGLPIIVYSCFPKAIYQEYLQSINEIKKLSNLVNQDTDEDSPLQIRLKHWKIKNDVLRYWIYEYHRIIKRRKLPALIPEIEVQPAQTESERNKKPNPAKSNKRAFDNKRLNMSVSKILNRLLAGTNERLSNEETEYLNKRSIQSSITRWFNTNFGKKPEIAIDRMTVQNKTERMSYNIALKTTFKDVHPYIFELIDKRLKLRLKKQGYKINKEGFVY